MSRIGFLQQRTKEFTCQGTLPLLLLAILQHFIPNLSFSINADQNSTPEFTCCGSRTLDQRNVQIFNPLSLSRLTVSRMIDELDSKIVQLREPPNLPDEKAKQSGSRRAVPSVELNDGPTFCDAAPAAEPGNEAMESIELDTNTLSRNVLAGQDDFEYSTSFEHSSEVTGLKPESHDPFLFDGVVASSEYFPTADHSHSLINASSDLSVLFPMQYNVNGGADGMFLHNEGDRSAFGVGFNREWPAENFVDTTHSNGAFAVPDAYQFMYAPQQLHVTQILDEHGRRRSQSMPPSAAMTFRRKLDNGRTVNITKTSAAPDTHPPPYPNHSAGIAAPHPSAHGSRYHPYERYRDTRGSSQMKGRSAMQSSPHVRSYPGTPVAVNSQMRSVANIGAEPPAQDTFRPPPHNHPAGQYRVVMTETDEGKRKGRPTGRRVMHPATNGPPMQHQDIESLLSPVFVQLDNLKASVFGQINELKYGTQNELEAYVSPSSRCILVS